jgi:hypothetical protein
MRKKYRGEKKKRKTSEIECRVFMPPTISLIAI